MLYPILSYGACVLIVLVERDSPVRVLHIEVTNMVVTHAFIHNIVITVTVIP